MLNPNLYILTEASGTWGVHEFKDGAQYLCKQHHSGDWFTIRPATSYEVNYMEDHGIKMGKKGKRLL